MKELLPTISKWIADKKQFAIATVTHAWGSSPRPIGSTMIISEDLEMAGSVSGGCVEGAVLKAAMEVMKNSNAQQLSYGVSNEEAWTVGLSCGGKIEIYLEPFMAFSTRQEEQAVWNELNNCLFNNKACVLVTALVNGKQQHSLVLPNGEVIGSLNNIKSIALKAHQERKNQKVVLEDKTYFVQVFPRQSQLLIIGAAHITVDLVTLAKMYDFETIVIDPRSVFTNKTQFTVAPDRLIEEYPAEVLEEFTLDAYTYAVVLSHDPKIDDNALHILLNSDVGYIGALGSRKTTAKRVARLKEAGFSEEAIQRIHAPIGVDIKAKRPKEIALSIMGEIIKVKNAFY